MDCDATEGGWQAHSSNAKATSNGEVFGIFFILFSSGNLPAKVTNANETHPLFICRNSRKIVVAVSFVLTFAEICPQNGGLIHNYLTASHP